MSDYPSTVIIFILLIHLSLVCTAPSLIKNRSLTLKNGSSFHIRQQIAAQSEKIRNLTAKTRDRLIIPQNTQEEEFEDDLDDPSSKQNQTTSVVVLTSLSGIYLWWPTVFGGDDTYHLLLTQEDVPRFHDVAGDDQGNIYLTAPHERTVYRLQYSNGWWIANFSNHSVMNSIRSEMPLFLNIHYISSIVYVYGDTDIQIIDLLQRPRTRGSAPFMKRLRELSPNLRISDMIIDQIKSDGYIIGDLYGWCTVIRCSLNVNECVFLFKVPSSYDNRPYSCTGTIDFERKIMYLSLEEKILGVHLNEQTNFDRRFILAYKRGSRSALGYDDIVTHKNVLLYTDVLRPLVHLCQLINSNPCSNISLVFPPPQRSILPLRLSIIRVPYLRPPPVLDDDDEEEGELPSDQSTTIATPLALIGSNKTMKPSSSLDDTESKSSVHKEITSRNIWMLILGICIGLLLAGVGFMVYYVIWNKNRPACKRDSSALDPDGSSKRRLLPRETSGADEIRPEFLPINSQSLDLSNGSATETSSASTAITSSSSSYHPETIL